MIHSNISRYYLDNTIYSTEHKNVFFLTVVIKAVYL